MRLKVRHETTYHYEDPVGHTLLQLRLIPKNSNGQNVISWETHVEGGKKELFYTDQYRNLVELISFASDQKEARIVSEGEVDCVLEDGVVGRHIGLAPLWYYCRQTELTAPGSGLRKFARDFSKDEGEIALCHNLMHAIRDAVSYQIGKTDATTTAEQALTAGFGVCQDHAHIMVAAARLLGFPARYVSGYLLLDDRVEQDASHAWAEVHIDGIGWIGFDVSNGVCPDQRYVRVATGLDYRGAAPTSGLRQGNGSASMVVSLQVQQ